MGKYKVFLAWGEIRSSGAFCAIAQILTAPRTAPTALTNFASEGRRVSNMGCKMTGIIGLVGTDHIFNVIGQILFEISAKN